MAELEKMKLNKKGTSLIEVMVAISVFSVVLGISSELVATGLKLPFAIVNLDSWSNFMEDSILVLRKEPEDSDIFKQVLVKDPFPKMKKPEDLSLWTLEWKPNNLTGYKTAFFRAKSKYGFEVNWRTYKKFP